MRLQLTPADRKILYIASGVFLLLIGTSLLIVRGASSDQDIPSAYSAASGGCKAAFLLLKESGYQVETWERPLSDLPLGKGTTLVLAEPAGFPGGNEKQKFAEFLKSGGRAIVTGRFAGFYLPTDEEVPEALTGQTWRTISALSPSPITRAAPEITLAPRAYWKPSTGTVGLYGETEKPVVVEYKVGKGRVLWLAEPTPLTNAGLKERGNLAFLLAAIGEPAGNRVLWDEFVHGYEHAAASARSWHIIDWIALQFAIFALVILATYSRRSTAFWLPETEKRLSPLEFVSTLGSLYHKANAGSVAVEISYQRFRYLLTRHFGLSISSSVGDLDRAVRERGEIRDPRFAETLAACESCRYDARVAPSRALHLVQALFDYAEKLKLIRPQGEKKAWKQS
jgi:Domain of unknown function (DUF4350)